MFKKIVSIIFTMNAIAYGMPLVSEAYRSTELVLLGKGVGASDVVLRVVTGDANTSDTDITRLKDVDVIVNAANEVCLGGGGVDGAVHRAAGKRLVEYIQEHFQPNHAGVRCPVGTAIATPAFNLEHHGVSCIVHAVGPTSNNPDKETLLAQVYPASLRAAAKYARAHNLTFKNIAFPSISTGIYGYPVMEACYVALDSVIQEINKGDFPFQEVRFVLWPDNYEYYAKALDVRKATMKFLGQLQTPVAMNGK